MLGLPPYRFERAGERLPGEPMTGELSLMGMDVRVAYCEVILAGLLTLAVAALEAAGRPVPQDLASTSARLLLGHHTEVL